MFISTSIITWQTDKQHAQVLPQGHQGHMSILLKIYFTKPCKNLIKDYFVSKQLKIQQDNHSIHVKADIFIRNSCSS